MLGIFTVITSGTFVERNRPEHQRANAPHRQVYSWTPVSPRSLVSTPASYALLYDQTRLWDGD
jgi:hypothetical protein